MKVNVVHPRLVPTATTRQQDRTAVDFSFVAKTVDDTIAGMQRFRDDVVALL